MLSPWRERAAAVLPMQHLSALQDPELSQTAEVDCIGPPSNARPELGILNALLIHRLLVAPLNIPAELALAPINRRQKSTPL